MGFASKKAPQKHTFKIKEIYWHVFLPYEEKEHRSLTDWRAFS